MRTWFKNARVEKKLSQGEIATRIGVTRQFISMIENGTANPRPNKAKALAIILEVHWTKFFETDNELFTKANQINIERDKHLDNNATNQNIHIG